MAGRRSVSKAQTREQLLEAAYRLFVEHGYAATSLEQIASEVGVTKPAIYKHFASKEDLFVALRVRHSRLADVDALEDGSGAYHERLAAVGRGAARMTEQTDPRVLALQLEFRAVSLRRPDARKQFAEEIRTLVAAAEEASGSDEQRLRPGVGEGEVVILGQLLIEGLREYRAFVPEIVTEETFATAFSLLAQLVDDHSEVPGNSSA